MIDTHVNKNKNITNKFHHFHLLSRLFSRECDLLKRFLSRDVDLDLADRLVLRDLLDLQNTQNQVESGALKRIENNSENSTSMYRTLSTKIFI